VSSEDGARKKKEKDQITIGKRNSSTDIMSVCRSLAYESVSGFKRFLDYYYDLLQFYVSCKLSVY